MTVKKSMIECHHCTMVVTAELFNMTDIGLADEASISDETFTF